MEERLFEIETDAFTPLQLDAEAEIVEPTPQGVARAMCKVATEVKGLNRKSTELLERVLEVVGEMVEEMRLLRLKMREDDARLERVLAQAERNTEAITRVADKLVEALARLPGP